VRVEGIGVGEIVFFGAVLGAELVEIVVGEKAAVAALPGADVDACDGECVGRLGGAEEHEGSIAWRQLSALSLVRAEGRGSQ
jgi:hypothetical protein